MLTFSRRISDRYSVRIRISERDDGDARESTFLKRERSEMTLPSQMHGAEVSTITEPGGDGGECDALITACPGALIGVRTADCVPIAIYGASPQNIPVVGVVHAGWRGIRAGVIDNAVQQIRACGAHNIHAIIGPHIGTECYEFGAADLQEIVDLVGMEAAGYTIDGNPALDMGSAVRKQLTRNSVAIDHDIRRCTARDSRYWSHRANGDTQRSALIAEIRMSK